MRLIFTILLIGLFKADAQIVINASAPYRSAFQFKGLLDDYSGAAAAYSLRKLDKDYTGSAIRVRKDTTGQPEQDIGFTANGDLDTASLKSFLNARSGFIVTWYSQGDTIKNMTQATQANQPRIALNGVIDMVNNLPAIRFDGSNDFMSLSSSIQTGTADVSFFIALNLRNSIISGSTGQSIYRHNRAVSGIDVFSFNETSALLSNERLSWLTNESGVRGVAQNTTNILLGKYLYSALFTKDPSGVTNTTNIYQNQVNQTLVNTSTGPFLDNFGPSGLTFIGGAAAGANPFNGSFFEFIFYNSYQNANLSAIQSNINNYYGIY